MNNIIVVSFIRSMKFVTFCGVDDGYLGGVSRSSTVEDVGNAAVRAGETLLLISHSSLSLFLKFLSSHGLMLEILVGSNRRPSFI